MTNKNTQGIWCRETNTFYYLESGEHNIYSSVDRVRNTLLAQGILKPILKAPKYNEEPYLIMTLGEAKKKNYIIEPIYLNEHIKILTEKEKSTKRESAWD